MTVPTLETVLYEKRDHIAFITLNRADVLNAQNAKVGEDITTALVDFNNDPDSWVAILSGAGERAFSAGADLKAMASTPSDAELARAADFTLFSPRLSRGLRIFKPIIAAVHGICMGGGLELAMSCDIILATENARIALPEVRRGILPGGGGTQRLPRRIPYGMAMELLMTGKEISGTEACRLGLVNRVVPTKEDVLREAEALAREIIDNVAPLSARAAKEAAVRGLETPLEEGLRIEALLFRMIRTTEDAREGPRAFVEKRKPQWKAR